LTGLTGNVIIPRQDAVATAYSVPEIGALNATQQILGQIALSPKRVGARQIYSKQLVFQSTPDIESFIRTDLFAVIALLWDYLGLNGQGAQSQPLGIMNTPGVQSIVFGGAPTYAQLVSMITALRKLNVRGPVSFASTPATAGIFRTTAVTLTGATTVVGGASNALLTPDDKIAGCDFIESNQIPNDQVILGGEGEAIKALWAGLDIVTDPFTLATNSEIVLTFNTWGDFAVRHPQAFNISADAGSQ
jgi:HK97 family phage major capsid protein